MINSVYIHIPFCKQKCLYCDFNSYDNKKDLINNYMKALYKERAKFSFDELKTIYIGGGTPSYIDAKLIVKLLDTLPKAEEITIEMNPCTVTKEKLEEYKKAGINRISIGLQTTDDNILKKIGRVHTFKQFEEAYELVINEGFENVNVDLMFGLPNQTFNILKDSVDYLVKLNPKHISCYSLIVHNNIFKNLPSDEQERKMYYYIKEKLRENGYIHYEISNFAKEGYESKHNLAYWNQEQYIGLGAGASSYVEGTRYTNVSEIEDYINKINSNEDIKIVEEIQNEESKLREYIILRLRLIEGINVDYTNKKFGINILDKFSREIYKMTNLGLIELKINSKGQETIALTDKGLDLANIVWEEFI